MYSSNFCAEFLQYHCLYPATDKQMIETKANKIVQVLTEHWSLRSLDSM